MDHSIGSMQIQEFARRTGVTVRTLHHYDRLGLLSPSGRTASGYRLYGKRELIRLQQIATLKFIGCSLNEIKAILSGPSSDLGETLRLQREALERKRRTLDRALRAVDRAQKLFAQSGEADWNALQHIIEVIQMEQDKSWMLQYFTPEQQAVLRARKSEIRIEGEDGWAKLIPEIEAAAKNNVDPASEEARLLIERHEQLVSLFTGGDPGMRAALERLYADKANWPKSFKRPFSEAAQGFIERAKQAHSMSCV
ncbi:MerR family transcriptional regulator [Alloacidobacterium dinghuense]|uniref:MerR family transcriptional regulator n=1 Tax=Alloacidobacterium dinghuense TaxID=2763107 RepID=A0A7G8BEN3_9BACT|nr:MerR family transcriptional regulator [Alloacidobacterium dinghuense]QNI31003.1 MerR family transcriptional regulator [Alloacidobacterium dinghuense]